MVGRRPGWHWLGLCIRSALPCVIIHTQNYRNSYCKAVFQDKDVYLLDDPLAAVDAFVAKHLFDKCIMGLLKRKTRILVTHHTKFLHKADFVIRMDQGKIVAAGNFINLDGSAH